MSLETDWFRAELVVEWWGFQSRMREVVERHQTPDEFEPHGMLEKLNSCEKKFKPFCISEGFAYLGNMVVCPPCRDQEGADCRVPKAEPS